MFSQQSIDGPHGVGKSQLAELESYGVYEDWDEVLKNIFFSLKPAFKRLKDARASSRKIKCLILDDVGAHASRYATFLKGGWSLVEAVNSTLDLAREAIYGGIIITSPDEDVMKVLREKSRLYTQVHWYRSYDGRLMTADDRVGVTYQRKRRPDGKAIVKRYKVDVYQVNKIPSDVLKQYYDMKTEASGPILDKTYDRVASIEDASLKDNPREQARRRVLFLRAKDPKEWTWEKIGKLEGHSEHWAREMGKIDRESTTTN